MSDTISDVELDLIGAIAKIRETMEEAEPANLDRMLLNAMARALHDAEPAEALEWAEGFNAYLEAA